MTPHGSVENLFLAPDAQYSTLPKNGSSIVSNSHIGNNKVQYGNETVAQNNLYQSNAHNNSTPCSSINQLRRSTSMSCSGQGGGTSTKTVTFTLPVTETNSVRKYFQLG